MNSLEIKSNFHNLIDNIQNDFLLKKFYDLLQKSKNKEGKLWDNLSESQREELIKSYDESFDTRNHIENEIVKNKYKEWL